MATLHPAFVANGSRLVLLEDSYEPVYACPYCNGPAYANYVDIGVGMQQCDPYSCDRCGAREFHSYCLPATMSELERVTGWYEPGSPDREPDPVDESLAVPAPPALVHDELPF